MKKKTTAVATMAFAVLLNGMTVFAAPETINVNGTDVVFDSEYYAANNPDIVAAVGNDRDALLQHYLSFGQSEGRLAYAPADTADEDVNQAATPATKKLVREIRHSTLSSSVSVTECTCDSKGNVIQRVDKLSQYVYAYDDQGNLLRESRYSDGDLWYDTTYDGRGNETMRWTSIWKQPTTWEYVYNSQGNPVSALRHTPIGNTAKEEWFYDDKGQLVRFLDYNYDGKTINGCIDYFYNEQGQLIKEAFSTEINELPYPGFEQNGMYAGNFDYVYDAQGKLIKKGGTTYEYDNMGNLVKESNSYGWTEYIYE